MPGQRPPTVVFIHSSDEMFGADRILLDVVDASIGIHPLVWLPADAPGAEDPLHLHLRTRGVDTRIDAVPIMRRRYLTPLRMPGLLWRAARLWLTLRRVKPTVVYCATSAALIAAPVARLAGVRVVVVHVQEIWAGREARVLALLARSATAVVAISESVRSALPAKLHHRTRVIVNACPDVIHPRPRPIESGDRPLRFLMASRWNSWKGHATLLAAWDSIVPAPGLLIVAGSPPAMGVAVDVPSLVARLRDPSSVVVLGQMTSLTTALDESDVVVMPSDDPEPFGLIAIEAFSRCRPVIGSSGGGLGSIIDDSRTGYLFENRSVEGLADVLAGIDRRAARSLGIAARQEFERAYSMERFARSIAALWEDILPRPVRSTHAGVE
ncbi:MAG: hypothetical protein RI885_1325 [Actinomycetota bacterium]|jgi:glycosyltransferase involved in cell wall biosynthesis